MQSNNNNNNNLHNPRTFRFLYCFTEHKVYRHKTNYAFITKFGSAKFDLEASRFMNISRDTISTHVKPFRQSTRFLAEIGSCSPSSYEINGLLPYTIKGEKDDMSKHTRFASLRQHTVELSLFRGFTLCVSFCL